MLLTEIFNPIKKQEPIKVLVPSPTAKDKK